MLLQNKGEVAIVKHNYTITFHAALTEEDVRAMNNVFYQAMNEAMQIDEVWGLDLTPDEENE